ncbi:MAG: flippase [Candidatus Paceibacterota bacterium]
MKNLLAIKGKTTEIWRHQGFQKYFKNTGWLFAGRIFSLAISFFVGIYVARYLGPSNYGLMSFAISFVGIFGVLSSLGIDEIVNREIVKNHNIKDKIIGTAFFIKISGSVLAIFFIFLASFAITDEMFTLILIWLFSLHYVPQAFNVIETYFQSQVLSKKIVKAQILSGIISAVLKLGVILLNKGIFWLLFIYVVEIALVALFLIVAFLKSGHHFKNWKFDKKIALSLLRDSWPMILSGLSVGVYMKIDQIMINHFLNNEATGIYAISVKLSEIWYLIPTIIGASIFPAIINSLSVSNEKFESRLSKLYFVMFWSSLIFSAVVSIFAQKIITLLFGEQYIGATPVLQVYIWSLVAVSLGIVIGKYLIAKNLTKITLYTTIIGALLNIVLNIILIPKMGIAGAAYATIISYLVVNFSIVLFKDSRAHFLLITKSIFNLNYKR